MDLSPRGDASIRRISGVSAPPLALTLRQPEREPFSGWYIGDQDRPWSDPAKNAYDRAIEILQKELTLKECQVIWLQDQGSMQQVQQAVTNAMEAYQMRSRGSKIRSWLASCSSRIMYYGSIFDMFSQHHPEYVSLAWGAMKFLFIAVLNHEELLIEISKAITKIADVLPRTELHSILYPTPRMQDAVSLVYAKILEFVVMAIKWYKKGKLMHSISAIAKPFKLSFQPVVADIMDQSRQVDELANAASKAEIRDLHVKIHGLSHDLVRVTEMIAVQQQQQTLHSQSLLAFQEEHRHLFRKNQVEDIRNIVFLEDAPLSDESLAYCRSMRDRRRQKVPTQLPVSALSKLKAWVSEPSSSLLLAQGRGIRTSSLDFATDFLDAVLERGYPVLWALQPATEDDRTKPSIVGVLRSLTCQALALDYRAVSEGPNPVNIKHFKTATGIQQWFTLFERCISKFPRLFLVIDVHLLEKAVAQGDPGHEFFRVSDFIEQLSEIVCSRHQASLKVLIVSWKFTATALLGSDGTFEQMQIFTDMGRKINMLMRQPKYRAMFKKRNQKSAERFKSSVLVESD